MVSRTMLWLVLGLIARGAGGLVAYRVGKARGVATALPAPSAGAKALLERTIKDPRVDDIVQHGGRDWLVEGVIDYDEDGHRWRVARTVDTPEERWFVVGLERTGPTTVRSLTRAKGLALTGYPPESIELEGVAYALAQRGTATTNLSGQFGEHPMAKGAVRNLSSRCRWWRYKAAGEKTLLVEQWGDAYFALTGDLLKLEDVDLLSAS